MGSVILTHFINKSKLSASKTHLVLSSDIREFIYWHLELGCNFEEINLWFHIFAKEVFLDVY
jgi:hypothetical protein